MDDIRFHLPFPANLQPISVSEKQATYRTWNDQAASYRYLGQAEDD